MMMHTSTFYSFKGGVGRTLLLVNVGVALARRGRRVLLWDLDLEAPGMHRIAGLQPQRAPASGFLEWLLRWQETNYGPVEGHLLESFLGLPYEVADIPGLSVLPAFSERSSFASLYQRINWYTFTVERPALGRKLFESLLDGLSERQEYEHVLIDSRTGITDLGGLLTAVLPHATVLVGNYSAQNTEGLLSIHRALQPAVDGRLPERRHGRLQRLLVASPVPRDESRQALESRRSLWNSRFESPPDETRVEIPFLGRLLFGEELLVDTDPRSPTAEEYQKVAARLMELREERILEEESIHRADLLYRDLAAPSSEGSAALMRAFAFEEQVEKLLRLLGYTVTREGRPDQGWDFIAHRKSGLLHEQFLVECRAVQQPLSRKLAEAATSRLREAIRHAPGSTPMLAATAFSLAALEFLRDQGVLALTLAELERELFDFKPYLAKLRRSHEESPLARTYVEPRFTPRPHEEEGAEVLKRALAWSRGEGSRLWLVLGEAGTGKTSFLQRLAYELATAAEKDGSLPAPLLIPLRSSSALISLESLLQEHMATSIGWRGDPAILLHLLETGRLVLLLDGLDEMGGVDASSSMREDQFRQLVRPAGLTPGSARGNRVLITSRTRYFLGEPRADGSRRVLAPLGRIARELGAEMDELAPWGGQQLREFLLRALGTERVARWSPLIDQLEGKPELLSRPLTLWILTQAASEPSFVEGDLNLGTLFQWLVDRWLLQQRTLHDLLPAVQDKETLLERLAWELRRQSQGRIHRYRLTSLLRDTLPSSMDADGVKSLVQALRTSPFLTLSLDGYFQFSSKLFEEFFYARHILRELDADRLADALDATPPTPDCAAFLVDLVRRSEDKAFLYIGVKSVLATPYRPRTSESALRLAYEVACRTAGGAGRESQAQMAALVPSGASLRGADLRGGQWAYAWLQGADLRDAWLDGADLTGADLSGVRGMGLRARGCILEGTNFEGADLRRVDFSDSTAPHHPPIFNRADLSGALLRGADWSHTEDA